MPQILLTAFEPFGLHKAASSLRTAGGRNESQEVLKRLMNGLDPSRYLGKVLSVDERKVEDFKSALAVHMPAGVFSMGEHLLVSQVVLEPYAHNVTLAKTPFFNRSKKVFSEAALRMGAEKASSKIEAYHCNRVYLEGLLWAEQHQRKCVFLHVPVLRSTPANCEDVMGYLREFSRQAGL